MPGLDSNVKLLLHCNGTDTSTTFTDDSFTGHTDTANGNAQIDTSQSKFGGASGQFDGTGDYVSFPNSSEWDFGTIDMAIDFWVRFDAIAGNQCFIGRPTSGVSYFYFAYEGSNNMRFRDFNSGNIIDLSFGDPSFAIDTWYHVALTRDGNNFRLFIDGTQFGSTQVSAASFLNRSDVLEIGGNSVINYYLNGRMDEFRLSVGDSRWTSDFTPPTEEYSTGETISINETVLINESTEVSTNPETIDINETVLINDINSAISPIISKFASKIISVNPLYIVTNEDPAKLVEVDITDPVNPVFTEVTLIGAKNAKSLAYNSETGFLFVACADGTVVKVDQTNLASQTIIDLSDTDDLLTIGTLSPFGIAYTGTENTSAELYMIDERDTALINTDFNFLTDKTSRVDTNFSFIEGVTIDTDFNFIAPIQAIINTDFKFLENEPNNVLCNPIKQTDFHVLIDDVELEDTDLVLSSISITKSVGEKDTATFTLARRHDDLNTTLSGNTVTITGQNNIKINVKSSIVFEGKIDRLDTAYSVNEEQIIVNAMSLDEGTCQFNNVQLPLPSLDEKLNIYHILLQNPSIYNPYIDPNDTNPSLYKGVFANLGDITTENVLRLSTFQEGTSLAEQIVEGLLPLKQNFTYFWFGRTAKFRPTEVASQTTEPNEQEDDDKTDGFLNFKGFEPLTIEFPEFDFQENTFQSQFSDFATTQAIYRYFGTSMSGLSSDLWELIGASYKYQRIYDNIVDASIITEEFDGGGSTFILDENPTLGFWSIRSILINGLPEENYTFIAPNQVNITNGTTSNDTIKIEYGIRDLAIGEAPYREISATNGVFEPKEKWVDRPDGFYREKSDGFNFDQYNQEILDLEYQKIININGDILPQATCEITTTIDSLLYYDLNILTRVNIDNTTSPNIYKNNNGFPVSIKSYTIDSNNMSVSLNCDNLKSNKELEELDGLFPDSEDERFNTEGYSIKVHTKYDLSTGEDVI